MIEIKFNKTKYSIEKSKIIRVLSKLNNSEMISEQDIEELMVKFGLYDEYFLENVNRL